MLIRLKEAADGGLNQGSGYNSKTVTAMEFHRTAQTDDLGAPNHKRYTK